MNTMNPFDFVNAWKPEQWSTSAAGYARTVLSEIEKQTERWVEYGNSQSAEAQKMFRAFQSQAFTVGKSIIDTAEKSFSKVG